MLSSPTPSSRRATLGDEPLLEVDSLSVDRGVLRVVERVSLVAPRGRCIGLLGLNGAGKSSLLASIAGLLPASEGSIRLGGADITRLPAWQRAADGLALVPSGRQLWPEVSVEDTLRI